VLLAAAAYAHAFALLVIPAHVLALALLPERPKRRAWVGPAALLAVLLAPLLLFFVTRSSDQTYWIARTTPSRTIDLLVQLMGNGGHGLAFVAMLGVLAALWLLVRGGVGPSRPWWLWFVVSWAGLPVALGIAASLVKPLLVPMYFVIVLPPLALVIAIGATRLPGAPGAVLVVALLVLGARSAYHARAHEEAEDWRGATSYLVAHARARDAFAVELPDERAGVEYYARRAGLPASLPVPCYPNDPWGRLVPHSGRRPPAATGEVLRCAAGRPRLWLEQRINDHLVTPDMQLTGWRQVAIVRFAGVQVLELVPTSP
jgi:hypothetical protein